MDHNQMPNPARGFLTPTASGNSDAELLQRMARNDKDAFQVLYQRYEQRLYCLALRVSKNRHNAEEGLQEALTKIWLRAGSFKPEGNAYVWIVRILVRECLKKGQKPAGPIANNHEQSLDQFPLAAPVPASTLERLEALSALGRLVRRLPLPDRRILTLYFSEGFTQQEIGSTLGIPQTTVSRELTRILGQLRANLGAMGAGANGVIEGLLHELLASQTVATLDFSERILFRVPRSPGSSVAPGVLPLKWAVAVVAVVGVASALQYAPRDEPAAPPQPIEAAEFASASGPAKAFAPVSPAKLNKRWTFESGIPADLSPFKGRWRWDPGKGNSPPTAMAQPHPESPLYIHLPFRVPASPLRLRASVRTPAEYFSPTQASITCGMSLFWSCPNGDAEPCTLYQKRQLYEAAGGVKLTVYVYREFVVSTFEDHLSKVLEYQRAYPRECLQLTFHGLALEQLSLEEIDQKELPILLQDPQRLRQHLKKDIGNWRWQLVQTTGNWPE